MFELTKTEMEIIQPLCAGKNDTGLKACLEGHLGRAWVDNKSKPGAAIVVAADFCHLLGSSDLLEKSISKEDLFELIKRKIIETDDLEWKAFIERSFKDCHRKFQRYSIKRETDVFDRQRLRGFVDRVKPVYELEPINERNWQKVLDDDFMADCCCFFSSFEEFMDNGIGYIIQNDDGIIAAASSYSYCLGNIDITIGTHENYRRKGLASACAAGVILDCLERGIYPNWSAANRESVSLAEKLGYHFDREYDVYMLR